MSFSERFTRIFRTVLPAPFTIAVVLTLFVFIVALFTTRPESTGIGEYSMDLMGFWESEMWNSAYLAFTVQMMLMLVLGHVMALSKPVNTFIMSIARFCNSTSRAAAIVTVLTVVVSLFNWGLGLIFGAILARKVGEFARDNQINLNYPLIGAAGYSGLMVWHGGISGSAPIKVAEEGAIPPLMEGSSMPVEKIAELPNSIPFDQTVFSQMNIVLSVVLIIALPALMYFIGKRSTSTSVKLRGSTITEDIENDPKGAEKLTHSKILAWMIGLFIVWYAIYKAFIKPDEITTDFINPNYINMVLLALGIIVHGNFYRFLNAIDKAIGGTAGILIQFPLYFGILGLMKHSGLMADISDFFISISNQTTYPIFTFFSAGLVNIFVPSGGGQWIVQGPIVIEAATNLGVGLDKSIMALSYGDQVTNMLQPFWALPLLAITGLKAQQILPYTIMLMIVGSLIFIGGLLVF